MKIDGKKIANDIIARLKKEKNPKKTLVAVLVGNDPRSASFIKQKEKAANELGIDFRIAKFEKDLEEDELKGNISKISNESSVGGVILQLPLPEQINKQKILDAIDSLKDVDALKGDGLISSPAVGVVKEILEVASVKLEETTIVVVGAGDLVGAPISQWLKDKCKEVFVLRSSDSKEVLKDVDVVISGVGKAGIIKPEMLREGAGVIDFGYHYFKDGSLSGDLDTKSDKLEKLAFYTGTPGGTGPILVAKLLENFYELCRK